MPWIHHVKFLVVKVIKWRKAKIHDGWFSVCWDEVRRGSYQFQTKTMGLDQWQGAFLRQNHRVDRYSGYTWCTGSSSCSRLTFPCGSIWHMYPNYPNSQLRFIPHIILFYNLYDVKIPRKIFHLSTILLPFSWNLHRQSSATHTVWLLHQVSMRALKSGSAPKASKTRHGGRRVCGTEQQKWISNGLIWWIYVVWLIPLNHYKWI